MKGFPNIRQATMVGLGAMALGALFSVSPLHAAEQVGVHNRSGSLSSHNRGGDAGPGGDSLGAASLGAGPRVINPGDDGGYDDDATIHRTGEGERTNVDGSEFETGLEGTSNTTFPGD